MSKEYNRPNIVIQANDVHLMIDEAEMALLESFRDLDNEGRAVFQRDGNIVGIGRYPFALAKEKTPVPRLLFVDKVKDNLIELFGKVATWTKTTTDKKGELKEKLVGCPTTVASMYLSRKGDWKLSVILGIITAPTMRPDGSIQYKNGYDPTTGLYLDTQGVEFPTIPDKPTKEDARKCLDFIISMVSEVPFIEDEKYGQVSRSVFLSAVLSALIRPILPAVPMHGFTAPAPGSGKSILVDAISQLMEGSPAAMLTQGDNKETEKVLSSALQAGMRVICFDNCEDPVGGAMLCQALTQPMLALRTLGKSELKNRTNTAMYFATGNNLTFTGDITRRALRGMIDAKCERPEERDFSTERPDIAFMNNRADLVAAGLIVIRAFVTAGFPNSGLKPIGSFEAWSQWVRDCLVWLGEPDPYLSTIGIRVEDPAMQSNITALTAWYQVFKDQKMMIKDVVETAIERPVTTALTPSAQASAPRYVHHDLLDALQNATGGGRLESQNLGNWARSIKDRPIGGFMIIQATMLNGIGRWQVFKLDETPAQDEPVTKPGSIFT